MKFDDDCTAYHDYFERRLMEEELTKPMGNQRTCTCGAYPYPHRMGYGLCDERPSTEEFVCDHCGSDDIEWFDAETLVCRNCGQRRRDV